MLRHGAFKNAMKSLNSERERSSFFLLAALPSDAVPEFLRANIFLKPQRNCC
jgi:hypothetical protein